jgi:hypothetical protein
LIAAAQLSEGSAQEVILCVKQAFLDGLCESVTIAAVVLFLAAAINLVILPKRTQRHQEATAEVGGDSALAPKNLN